MACPYKFFLLSITIGTFVPNHYIQFLIQYLDDEYIQRLHEYKRRKKLIEYAGAKREEGGAKLTKLASTYRSTS
jgi:hypothetical protein